MLDGAHHSSRRFAEFRFKTIIMRIPFLLVSLCCMVASASGAERHPNILLILSDDHGWSLEDGKRRDAAIDAEKRKGRGRSLRRHSHATRDSGQPSCQGEWNSGRRPAETCKCARGQNKREYPVFLYPPEESAAVPKVYHQLYTQDGLKR